MIKPIVTNMPSFRADKETIDKNTGDYKDPLMRWPMRGAAFTNEIGEALRPVIGGYATLTWAPALMYIGADIYDKYKNDQTEYSPNSRRGLKQAVFQGMASILLPIVAVKLGQGAFSQFGKLTEDKISYKAKEHVSSVAEGFIANGKMRAFEGKDAECVEEFVSQVMHSFDYNTEKKSIKNFLRIFKKSQTHNVENYARKTMRELIQIRKDLLYPTTEKKSGKLYGEYIKALQAGQTESVATKSVLANYQKRKMLKGKVVKTLGGFTALALAIKPVDYFVENVLIGKVLGPRIDNYTKKNK